MSKVDHPQHYNMGNVEVIDIIEGWHLGFHAGNAIKYILRHRYKKNPVEDLKKAKWYIERLIELTQKEQDETPER